MADYFRWYTVGNGSFIDIGGAGSDLILRDYQGVSSNLVNEQSQKAPFQFGESYLNPNINPRVISINCRMRADSTQDMHEKRRNLIPYFRAEPEILAGRAEMGLLRFYRDGQEVIEIPCVPINSPQFSYITLKGTVIEADFDFYCPYPYWQASNEIFHQFDTSGGLEFPIEFPMEILSYNLQTDASNTGDVSAPFLARVYGELDTFRLINETTGEELEVTGVIADGDYIEVNTAFGNKTVELIEPGGERTNVFGRVSLDKSDFWRLEVGNNVISFEVNSSTTGYAVMYWRDRYIGV